MKTFAIVALVSSSFMLSGCHWWFDPDVRGHAYYRDHDDYNNFRHHNRHYRYVDDYDYYRAEPYYGGGVGFRF